MLKRRVGGGVCEAGRVRARAPQPGGSQRGPRVAALREVGAHITKKKTGALPPGRSIEALIGSDGGDAWVVQKTLE